MTKVVFETATFADAIKKASRVSPSKGQAFDKAAGIVIDVDPSSDDPITIRATNLQIFSTEWVDCVEAEGEPATWRVPSQLFTQVVSSLPIGSERTVTLEEKTNGRITILHLSSGKTKARFNLMSVEYYPYWNVFDPDEMYPANDLGGRVAQVEWAAAQGVEPPLCGISLDGEKVIATDRYRLAMSDLKIPDLKEPIVVPAGMLGTILKQTGEVSIGVEDGQLLIMPDEHTQIRAVVFDTQYPQVDRIARRDYPNILRVRKAAILEIMQRASNFAGSDRFPTLRVFFGKGEIAVMMDNNEVGLLGDVVDVPGYADHDRVEIKFTPKNIMDAITNSPNDEVEIGYDTSNAARIVYVNGGSGYECWVMPRRADQPQEG